MFQFSVGSRNIRLIAPIVLAGLTVTACKSDSVTGSSYTECSTEPGCQQVAATVAPEVIQSLDDANTRVIAEIQPASRKSIEASMITLQSALMARDIVRGRAAFQAAIAAITAAERISVESRPELGALRLNLVPAARSLGLPVSDTDAPAY